MQVRQMEHSEAYPFELSEIFSLSGSFWILYKGAECSNSSWQHYSYNLRTSLQVTVVLAG